MKMNFQHNQNKMKELLLKEDNLDKLDKIQIKFR